MQEVGLGEEVLRRPALLNTVEELQSLDAVEYVQARSDAVTLVAVDG